MRISHLAASIAFAAASASAGSASADSPFRTGSPAPDLVLPSLDGGKPLSLAAFSGKKLLLLVFASW